MHNLNLHSIDTAAVLGFWKFRPIFVLLCLPSRTFGWHSNRLRQQFPSNRIFVDRSQHFNGPLKLIEMSVFTALCAI